MRALSWLAAFATAAASTVLAEECGEGTQAVNRTVVPVEEIQLRTSPAPNASLVVNPKASAAFRRTMYAQIDPSTKVTEVCRKGTWSYVALFEPEWLRESHRGWVPSKTLGVILRDKAGKRIYRESEIGWGSDTRPFKKDLMFAVNGFLQDECDKALDTYSLARSPTRGTKADPVFFITCGTPPTARNIHFSRSDIRKHRGTRK